MNQIMQRFVEDPNVRLVYEGWPTKQCVTALRLRDLVLDTHAGIERAGRLVETLKWGEPSYLTEKPATGSTVRIAPMKGREDAVGLFFICTSGLVEHFRELYGNELQFEGNRAIVVETEGVLPQEALCHCIGLALTRKLWKSGNSIS